MFFRKKEKVSNKFNKLIMGAIIGGAIGSVIGASLKTKNPEEENPEEEFVHDIKKANKKGILRRIFFRKDKEDFQEIPRG